MEDPRRVKLADVAAATGVSLSTASLVLSGKAQRLRAETRDKVLKAAQEMGYQPNLLARAKGRLAARHHTGDLRVVLLFKSTGDVPEFGYPYLQRIMLGLEHVLHEQHDLLIPVPADHGGHENPDALPSLVLSQDFDAAVVMGEVATRQLCLFLRQREIPTVIIDNKVGLTEFNHVGLDNIGGTRAAADHLFAQGYPRVAMIAGRQSVTDQQPRSDTRERVEGFQLALLAAGQPWDPQLVYEDKFEVPKGGQRGAAELIERWGTPLGLVCFDDLFAWQALNECHRRGLRVPEDVGIVGFDDIRSLTEMTTPTLSSVRVPWEQIGRTAAGLVLAERKDPGQNPALMVCPTQLIIRASSNLLARPVGTAR